MQAILYITPDCPYCKRAKSTLNYAQIDVKLISIDLKQRPTELTNLKADASVPFLVLEDNIFIDESWDICKWALQRNDPQQWIGNDSQALLDNEMLIETNDHSFAESLRDLLNDKGNSEAKQDCEEILLEFERQLEQHSYLVSDQLSAADVAIAPFIQQYADIQASQFFTAAYTRLQHWLTTITQAPFYQ